MVSVLILFSLLHNIGFLNEFMYSLLIGIVISMMIIYIFTQIFDILSRDNLNFDEYSKNNHSYAGLSNLDKGIVNYDDEDYNPLFKLGYGLTY